MPRLAKRFFAGAVVAMAVAALPASASAATTQIGSLPSPFTLGCQSDASYDAIFYMSGGSSVPSGTWTLTNWQTEAAQGQVNLMVLRPTAPNQYQVVAETASQTLQPGGLQTFSANIPVQSGDVIGFGARGLGSCAGNGPGKTMAINIGNPAPGATVSPQATYANYALSLRATLTSPDLVTGAGLISGNAFDFDVDSDADGSNDRGTIQFVDQSSGNEINGDVVCASVSGARAFIVYEDAAGEPARKTVGGTVLVEDNGASGDTQANGRLAKPAFKKLAADCPVPAAAGRPILSGGITVG